MEYLYSDAQKRLDETFNRSRHEKLFVAECSRQIGKTIYAATKASKVAKLYPGCEIRIGTAFFNDLESITLPAFKFVLQDCPENLRPRWIGQKGKFVFDAYGGSEIRLVGLDRNPDKMRGNKLRLIIIDEAGFCEDLRYLYKSVIIPATTHCPDARVMMLSTPPASGNDHDFCDFADEAMLADCYIKLTIDDNDLLTEARKEEIAMEYAPKDPTLTRAEKIALGRASSAFRREYLCERIIDETKAVIPEFDISRHVKITPTNEYRQFFHQYVSLDSGVRDHTALLFGHYDFQRGVLCIEDEFSIHGKDVTSRAISDGGKLKEATHWANHPNVYLRIADNDNQILLQDMAAEFSYSFLPTSKDLLIAMVNKVRLWFQSGRIEIHPRCAGLIGCLGAALWNERRDEFERTKSYGHADLLSALIYLVRNVNEHTNPIPNNFGLAFNQIKQPTRERNELKNAFVPRFAKRRG